MITVKVHAPCGTIILDRPAKCNALNRQMVADLAQAFDDLRQERRVRVIILTGAGTHFCAGVDLANGKNPPQHQRPCNNTTKTRMVCRN